MQHEISQWVKEYSRELMSWAVYKTSSKEIAEDLVQETFFSAIKQFESFEGRSQPKTWLLTILNNKIKEHYRKKGKLLFQHPSSQEVAAHRLTDDMFDEKESWSLNEVPKNWDEQNPLDNPEFNEMLERCIGHLPEKWRLAIIMKYRSDLDASQICQDLELSISNYWQIIHRAKLMLKKCVDTNW